MFCFQSHLIYYQSENDTCDFDVFLPRKYKLEFHLDSFLLSLSFCRFGIWLYCRICRMAELPIIHDCFWNSLVINIDYHCDCVAMISLEVLRSGQTFMHVEHPPLSLGWGCLWRWWGVPRQRTHCDISIHFSNCEGNTWNIRIDP